MRALAFFVSLIACTTPQGEAAEPRQGASDPGTDFVTVELSTVGMDLTTHSPVVLLRAEETGDVIPIFIGLAEAEAIARSLHGIEMPRPMTHDLLANLLSEFGGVLQEVRVHAIREGTYYGALLVRVNGAGGESIRTIDSRPSDAMALALRAGAPIRVARELMQDAPDVDFRAPGEDAEVVRALGVSVIRATPQVREELGIPDRPGVAVTAVTDAAAEAGMRRGDLVLSVDGRPIQRPMEFLDAARAATGRDSVEIEVLRDGAERTIHLTPEVRDRPRDPQRRTIST